MTLEVQSSQVIHPCAHLVVGKETGRLFPDSFGLHVFGIVGLTVCFAGITKFDVLLAEQFLLGGQVRSHKPAGAVQGVCARLRSVFVPTRNPSYADYATSSHRAPELFLIPKMPHKIIQGGAEIEQTTFSSDPTLTDPSGWLSFTANSECNSFLIHTPNCHSSEMVSLLCFLKPFHIHWRELDRIKPADNVSRSSGAVKP